MSTEMKGQPRNRTSTRDDPAKTSQVSIVEPMEPDQAIAAADTEGAVKAASKKTLDPLFTEDAAADFRSRWDVVQRSFVDDPRAAVRDGDELVAEVIKSLAEIFSDQRSELEDDLHQTDQTSTENLRLSLRRYRSFFERLLSI